MYDALKLSQGTDTSSICPLHHLVGKLVITNTSDYRMTIAVTHYDQYSSQLITLSQNRL